MQSLQIGHLKAALPIVQGGMGIGISMANLSSAVANEGGIGVISAAGVGMFENPLKKEPITALTDSLRQEIQKARTMTKGILGVNIMVAMTHFSQLVEAALEEEIDIIFAGAGLPLALPGFLQPHHKTKLIPIVSSGRAARIITQKWLDKYDYLPDGFVLEGPKAGGHLGFKKDQIDHPEFQLEVLLPELIETLKPFEETHHKKIPIIVAGGIYTGEDMHYFLSQGAHGVQMATRFVTTEECDASDAFKHVYINAKEEDVEIISSPVGLPGRAIHNDYLEAVAEGKKHPFTCPYNCIVTCKKELAPYCIALALYSAKKGVMKQGFAFAGTNAYRADKIISVKTLIQSIKSEYEQAISPNQT